MCVQDLLVCEYCDQGVHFTCLHPRPEKRPRVWNCDDCRRARGMQPIGNVKKCSSVIPDVVKKTAAKYDMIIVMMIFLTYEQFQVVICQPDGLERAGG